MTRNLHARIFGTRSSFANAIVAAYVIFVGDLFCVIGDLIWLLHDALFPTQRWMYSLIALILVVALILIAGSGYWMFKSIDMYLIKHAKAKRKLHCCKKVL
jgi:hypothetical protein